MSSVHRQKASGLNRPSSFTRSTPVALRRIHNAGLCEGRRGSVESYSEGEGRGEGGSGAGHRLSRHCRGAIRRESYDFATATLSATQLRAHHLVGVVLPLEMEFGGNQ
jgi:hypothetical protein